MGEYGVIRESQILAAVPPEIEIAVDQFPPETTHEVDGPTRLYPIHSHLLSLLQTPPRFRPPPSPFGPVPDPPNHRPGYISVPPGIRAVFTTGTELLRSQPEMNHPPRPIPKVAPRRPGEIPSLDHEAVMRRWAILLDERPEINPIA